MYLSLYKICSGLSVDQNVLQISQREAETEYGEFNLSSCIT